MMDEQVFHTEPCPVATRLLVCGSRDFDNREQFDACLQAWIEQYGTPSVIYSGGAKGADTMAKQFAQENKIRFQVYVANWKRYGKAAGPIRNTQMVAECTHVLAFPKKHVPGGGTRDTIKKARAEGRNVEIYEID